MELENVALKEVRSSSTTTAGLGALHGHAAAMDHDFRAIQTHTGDPDAPVSTLETFVVGAAS